MAEVTGGGEAAAETGARTGVPPFLAALVAWLVPGGGHFLLGRHFRAVAYFGIVLTLFSLGLGLKGRLDRPDPQSPLSYFKTAADLGAGPLYLVFVALGGREPEPAGEAPPSVRAGVGDPRSPTYEHGTTFLLTAGILNILLIFDAWDIASGRKREA